MSRTVLLSYTSQPPISIQERSISQLVSSHEPLGGQFDSIFIYGLITPYAPGHTIFKKRNKSHDKEWRVERTESYGISQDTLRQLQFFLEHVGGGMSKALQEPVESNINATGPVEEKIMRKDSYKCMQGTHDTWQQRYCQTNGSYCLDVYVECNSPDLQC
ncbi:hypothetical protein L211DRAFT_848495 [Terfezia boudieri ATCC MYA-4762]|uniref:Uncharacterized protein n=1 Tax=Terfezia boudieri ATCC MYA-4762 TaxID=1051890 RepID=A0A3N4M4A8_9PEZI|nr:hypothetical protein L211DRAFT_848495 [Terfezia boudieri ATCC MYA-4762]